MNASLIQLLVLAGIAVFLILKLRSVLGTRDGFEKPNSAADPQIAKPKREFEVIQGGPDRDIVDHVADGSPAAKALASMKQAEPSFNVGEFLRGARGAYEMILMSFERGDINAIRPFLSADVEHSFSEAIDARDRDGKTTEANFIGLRELTLTNAVYDPVTKVGEITVRFMGELTSVTRDKAGTVVEGSATEIRRQRDSWSFGRKLGAADPNWQLVATGDE